MGFSYFPYTYLMPESLQKKAQVKKRRRRDVPLWARRLAAAFEFAGMTDRKGNVDKKRVGAILHVVPKTVESWITGRTQPRYEKLIRVREITNISLDWVLTDRPLPEEGIRFFKSFEK